VSQVKVVRVEAKEEERAWEEYAQRSPETNFFHLIEWKEILRATYGYEPFYLLARQGKEVKGIFPLFLVKSMLSGRTFKSLPFHFLGGPVGESEDVLSTFFSEAKALCENYQGNYLEFRSSQRYEEHRYSELRVSRVYTSFVTPLVKNHSEVFKSFKENIKRFIKKSEKEVAVKVVENSAGLQLFYHQYCAGMSEIGVPPHRYLLFDELFKRFAEKKMVRITLAFYQGKPIASLVTLIFKSRILFWWGVRDFRFQHIPSTHALHWESIKWGCEQGYAYYDFGMTSPVEENAIAFKSRWGTFPREIFFYRLGGSGSVDYDYHVHFKTARRLWKYLPLPLVKFLGPLAARQMG